MLKSNLRLNYIFLFFLLLILTSCKETVVNETKIIEDLNLTNIVNLVIEDNPISINVNEITIEKRQTKDKDDYIYAKVTQNNSNFNVESYVEIRYTLFDNNGWELSEFTVQEGPSIMVNSGISSTIPDNYMSENYSRFMYVNSKFEKNNQKDIYTYTFEGESNTARYSGKVDLEYVFDYQWKLINSTEYDSKIEFSPLGKWIITDVSDKYSTWEINIEKINTENKNINYSYKKLKHNINTGNYDVAYESSSNLILNYSIEDNVLVFEPLVYTDDKFLGGTKKEILISIDKWSLYYSDMYSHQLKKAQYK